MTLPYRILVLDDDERALSGVVELLEDAGHHVTGAPTYEGAKQLLAVSPFDLLISDVRLRSFNGLNLIMQARADHPEMAVMIMTGYDDPLIDLEAHRYNAPLVKKPIRPQEFLKLVASTLVHVRRVRRWPRKRVVGGFRVTAAGRPAAVVDVSYGGLRLEMRDGPAPAGRFDVEISGIGLRLEAESVWTDALAAARRSVCGASLTEDQTPAARTWRDIVDRLNASA